MGGRQLFPHPRTTAGTARSLPLILAFSSLLLLAISFLYFSSSTSSSDASSFSLHSSQHPDYSFLDSLDKFLKPASHPHDHNHDDTVVVSSGKLDDSIWKVETQKLYQGISSSPPPLRVYVYQMPSKFTHDLLRLFVTTYRDTSNLTSNGSPVHRLIEQHSIDYWLWADLVAPESERLLNNVVVRVQKQEEADLFYFPFFTTISFFLLEKQQCKALYRV